jgi:hypothetical protein
MFVFCLILTCAAIFAQQRTEKDVGKEFTLTFYNDIGFPFTVKAVYQRSYYQIYRLINNQIIMEVDGGTARGFDVPQGVKNPQGLYEYIRSNVVPFVYEVLETKPTSGEFVRVFSKDSNSNYYCWLDNDRVHFLVDSYKVK